MENKKRKEIDEESSEKKKLKPQSSDKKPSKIQLKLSTTLPKPKETEKIKEEKISKIFGDDDSEEDTQEMPLEAKMKMRNIGRNTPTATGPNSYGKTKLGFCDHRKLFEKQLKEKADELSKQS